MAAAPPSVLTRDDFKTPQDVRWCPGCGDYSILAAVQKVFAGLGRPREQFAVISGIGCSSRFPYYVNTYGFHTIHGRAPAVATGLKLSRPELDVWVITGDGDSLSIGTNHLVHALRRNIGLHILLFNNRIYGLTKGQYSPTSEFGKRTRSTPYGSVDRPFDAVRLALGAGATFVARTIDREPAHLAEMLRRAARHRGTSLVEIYQNCNIFNDGAFADLTDKARKADTQLRLEHGKPLLFGRGGTKGIAFDGWRARVVDVEREGLDAVTVHDETAPLGYHMALAELELPDFPVPIGVFRDVEAPPYEELVHEQIEQVRASEPADLAALLRGKHPWTVGAREATEAQSTS